ncbi:ribulose bisphosphate carboxylase small chain clone 512 [Selaginella moellendorffii]|nr:ribulose bisphosphate carboxylase small chain clone 512 [Selaginella moellendorffii]|eukprot:XP_002982855.2 ribulose bisphosphate carboxylase small chain clone 512 [Selaginella moellendorffii]
MAAAASVFLRFPGGVWDHPRSTSRSSPRSSFLWPLKGATRAFRNLIAKTSRVSSGSRVNCMQIVCPLSNSRFETLSYLPPLSPDNVAREIDYMLSKNWIPCLEFDHVGAISRENSREPGYYDGRYWTLWKLPMFGCSDPAQVLREIEECKSMYPNAYIRVLGFDNIRQVQCISFIVQKPSKKHSE